MKRDWDMIRDLLLKIEAFEPGYQARFSKHDGTSAEAIEMLSLLESGGFIDVSSHRGADKVFMTRSPGLTWQGHELIDSIRDDGVWKSTKERMSKVGGSVGVKVMVQLASAVIKEKLGLG